MMAVIEPMRVKIARPQPRATMARDFELPSHSDMAKESARAKEQT